MIDSICILVTPQIADYLQILRARSKAATLAPRQLAALTAELPAAVFIEILKKRNEIT